VRTENLPPRLKQMTLAHAYSFAAEMWESGLLTTAALDAHEQKLARASGLQLPAFPVFGRAELEWLLGDFFLDNGWERFLEAREYFAWLLHASRRAGRIGKAVFDDFMRRLPPAELDWRPIPGGPPEWRRGERPNFPWQ
jgi:hypothetical protein